MKQEDKDLLFKALCMYLPYGVQVTAIRTPFKLTLDNFKNVNPYVKPILRPLSQLTQEIEHNGEKFIPFERIQDSHELWEYTNIPIQCDYSTLMQLLSWHFDVFGLLEKGLSIEKTK